jgi:regulator of sirC expression with transglutaminase-like and TPR domain
MESKSAKHKKDRTKKIRKSEKQQRKKQISHKKDHSSDSDSSSGSSSEEISETSSDSDEKSEIVYNKIFLKRVRFSENSKSSINSKNLEYKDILEHVDLTTNYVNNSQVDGISDSL